MFRLPLWGNWLQAMRKMGICRFAGERAGNGMDKGALRMMFGMRVRGGLLAILIFFIVLNRRTKFVRSRVFKRFQKRPK